MLHALILDGIKSQSLPWQPGARHSTTLTTENLGHRRNRKGRLCAKEPLFHHPQSQVPAPCPTASNDKTMQAIYTPQRCPDGASQASLVFTGHFGSCKAGSNCPWMGQAALRWAWKDQARRDLLAVALTPSTPLLLPVTCTVPSRAPQWETASSRDPTAPSPGAAGREVLAWA